MNPLANWMRRRRFDAEDRILRALDTDEWSYGDDLRRTGRGLFRALNRLEKLGWVEAEWSDDGRRMYRRTLGGEALVL